MRTIHRLIEADKTRKENGEAGFSLIELIIVVVILGILAAIAVPIFLNVQDNAEQSALDAIAGNAASAVAGDLANAEPKTVAGGGAAISTDIYKTSDAAVTVTITSPAADTDVTVSNFCVTAEKGDKSATSGPGCAAG